MLSLFPDLLTYQLVAPLLLRVVLGAIFIFWSYKRFNPGTNVKRTGKSTVWASLEAIVGILLVIGLFTQLAALIASLAFLVYIVMKIKHKAFLTDGVNYYVILFVIALSLVFTGAGFLAFDLPL